MITLLQHNSSIEWRLDARICVAGVRWLEDTDTYLSPSLHDLQTCRAIPHNRIDLRLIPWLSGICSS
jgi:hypothetical protein